MQHRPSTISSGVPPYAIALAARALTAGKIVIYAGAGISLSQPTDLPSGATLSSMIHARLKIAFPALESVNERDLVAVADAVAAQAGGGEALREAAQRSAKFTTAKPAYAHRALAHLLLEGAIDVLTTNWDTCIERSAGEERLPIVTNQQDLARVMPPWVLKIHGCASQPDSLLVTRDDLDNPPAWVREQTHARLGSAVVVFIGIGDVAGYVKQRVGEAIEDVGQVNNIRVVAPDINTAWEQSQWRAVAPDLQDEHRIPATADQFMEELAAAYILGRIDDHRDGISQDSSLVLDLEQARKGLFESDALTVLEWARHVDINPRVGEPVLKSPELGKALVALGHLAGDTARLRPDHMFDTGEGPIEVIIATETVLPRRLIEVAENRLEDHAYRGEPLPKFVVAGGVGPLTRTKSLPTSIINAAADESDIVDGPFAIVPDIMHADEVLAS